MKNVIIASFYKFVSLSDLEILRESMLAEMRSIQLKGTIILATEGINGSFAGSREQIDAYCQFLRQDERFANLNFKETMDDKIPFDKAKVKLREEIVTMGVEGIQPQNLQDTYLDPQQWHELIQDPEVVLLDTRNIYEYELGTFKNAINPNLDNFREFPDYVEKHLSDKKDKKIAMFCTGGIRCEKTTAYMKNLGFEKIYQLHDGILNYMEQYAGQESLWQGDCFVFDDRVAVNQKLDRVYPQLPDNKSKK